MSGSYNKTKTNLQKIITETEKARKKRTQEYKPKTLNKTQSQKKNNKPNPHLNRNTKLSSNSYKKRKELSIIFQTERDLFFNFLIYKEIMYFCISCSVE